MLDLSAFSMEDFQPLVGNTTTPKKVEKYADEEVLMFHPIEGKNRAKMELSSKACELLGIDPESINSENKVGVNIVSTPTGEIIIKKGTFFNVGKNKRFTSAPYYEKLVKMFDLNTENLVLSLCPTSLENVLQISNYIVPTTEEVEEVLFETNIPQLPEVVSEVSEVNDHEELVMVEGSSYNPSSNGTAW